jgi:V/A-type H+-transporting ATPase subunit D
MAQDVKPTRSELIATRRRIKLSQTGHKLLKMKRDGLMYELFNILPKVREIRNDLVKMYRGSLQRMAIAEAVEGRIGVKSIAYTEKNPPTIVVGEKNIMGVVVPTVKGHAVRKPLHERGYGVIGTSPHVDEVVDSYESLVDQIVLAAELETTMKRLLEDIEKTKRRVNALEFKVIPDLKRTAAFIAFRLEEIERENIFRLKKIKQKAEQAKEEEARKTREEHARALIPVAHPTEWPLATR